MRFLFLSLFLFSSATLAAEFKGHYKAQGSVSSDVEYLDTQAYGINNQLALKTTGNYQKVFFEGAYQLDLSISRRLVGTPYIYTDIKFPYRVDDLKIDLIHERSDDGESISLYQNLNRLNANFSIGKYEFSFGRLPVSFGAGRVISPLDIWAPFGISEIDTEDRLGVDSLRVKRSLGEMGQLDFGIVLSDRHDNENVHGFIDAKFGVWGTDFEFNVASFYQNYLYGISIQGDVLGAGYWGDVAYSYMRDRKNYTRATFGLDYAITPLVTVSCEYHYNGAGSREINNYMADFMENDAYLEGSVFLLAQDYFIPSVSWSVHPLVTLSGNVIFNMDDLGQYYGLKMEYNVAEDYYLDAGGYLSAFGRENSEFSLYSDFLFASLRTYF